MAAHSSTPLGQDPFLSKRILLLLGERLSGKSSVGNTILGKREFDTGIMTTHSSKRKGTVAGRQVTVVDTPGWYVGRSTPGSVAQELGRALSLCSLGPHAILLVVSAIGDFSQGEWRAMEEHLRQIQAPIWQRAIVLLTHGAEIPRGTSAEEHIRGKGKSLLWLVERCGNKFHVLDSHARDKQVQVQLLLEKIDRMVEINRRPREIQERLYTQVRESLRMGGGKQQGEDIEMLVMQDMRTRQNQRVTAVVPIETSKCRPAAFGLVLLGRRCSGKSSAGNTILGRREFGSGKRTVHCVVGQGEVGGRTVAVVDTPGWSLYGLSNPKQVRLEMRGSASLCPYGVVCTFLLAIPVDSFTEKDRCAVEKYLSVLGEGVWRSTMVLFTYGDELRGRTIEEHIEKTGEPLRGLLAKCSHRYHVLDNNIKGDLTQVVELLQMVEQL
ncbi:GTPase IMAP family member 8-like [Oncorhynchus nerka]|uniref:GTPase IMAP family member 8-like n=1 Tax=Oncorhynchus nerka TaxID=8023 RepID=UPI0011322A69|nr:GTPase IMAP family member 8-like [Oncorhynchus nerka]